LKFGDDIIYDIKNALKNSPNDSIWQDNMIRLLLKLDSNKIKELEVELIKIVSNADEDGASITALEILYNKQIIEKTEIEFYANFLLSKYSSDKYNSMDIVALTNKIKKADNTMYRI
jgi:hypothetical protein